MKLCMFSPKELDLERGWPGRIEGDRVVQLAAQTLQAFFTGGGSARGDAEDPPADGGVPRAGSLPAEHPLLRALRGAAGALLLLREHGLDLRPRGGDPWSRGRRRTRL